jgi:hypothetical protein
LPKPAEVTVVGKGTCQLRARSLHDNGGGAGCKGGLGGGKAVPASFHHDQLSKVIDSSSSSFIWYGGYQILWAVREPSQ